MMVSVVCDITVETLSGTGAVLTKRAAKAAEVRIGRHGKLGEVSIITTIKGNEHAVALNGAISIHKRFLQQGKATIRILKPSAQILLSRAVPEELLDFLEGTIALKEGRSCVPRRSPLADRDPNRQQNGGKHTPEKRVISKKILFQQREKVVITPRTKNRLTADLSEEQRKVFGAVMDGKSMFFTGGAGTGKSFLLRRIIDALPKETTFATSTTGVAATNINATTIQSFTGIYDATKDMQHCLGQAKRRADQWRLCKVLVIDEVSMLDAEYLEKMEAIARILRHSTHPFGGIQLVFCGDFLQLPPVSKDPANRKKYCFQSPVWAKCIPHVIELRQVFRQKDPEFVRMLRKMRVGMCTDDVIQMLKETRKNDLEKDGILPTELCTHVGGVDSSNERFLSQLPGQATSFDCLDYYHNDSSEWMQRQLDNLCPAPKKLVLKVGAQVMLVKNRDVKNGLVNGSRGVVIRITAAENGPKKVPARPVVRFVNGTDLELGPETWSVTSHGRELASRTQIPLKLSWALSIHKSQGMSLDCVKVDISRVFEHGQAYVALSRARTLDRLVVTNFSPEAITADPVALRFYRDLREKMKAESAADKENAPRAS